MNLAASALILAAMILVGGLGDLLLSYGMRRMGEVSLRPLRRFAGHLLRAMRQPWVTAGIVCSALYLVIYLSALSWIDVSVVVPVSSGTYVLTTLAARFFLGERVPARRWLGTLLVTLGVVMVAWSQQR